MLAINRKEERETQMLVDFFSRFGTIKVPKCYKCQAPVEEFGVTTDADKNLITFTAKCHDEKESLRMEYAKVMNLPKDIDGVASAYAFYKPSTLILGERIIL